MSGLRTAASECSSWPTARAEDSESCGNHDNPNSHPGESLTGVTRDWATPTSHERTHSSRSVDHGEQLANQVDQWPTPAVDRRDNRGGANPLGPERPSLETLGRTWPSPRSISGGAESAQRKQDLGRLESGGGDLQATAEQWATPQARDWKSTPLAHTNGGRDLAQDTSQWATPTSRDHKDSDGMAQEAFDKSGKFRNRIDQLARQAFFRSGRPDQWSTTNGSASSRTIRSSRRRLNPNFVDWLMGFPPGWTGCARLGTPSYRSWLRRHSCILRDASD